MTDLRNLPDAVLARLGEAGVAVGIDDRAGRTLEHVRFTPEVRVDDEGTATLVGYATVYDHPYDVAGGPPYGWVETITRGACDLSVSQRDDVRLLINHDGLPLARTRSKTLQLLSDEQGLRCEAVLDSRSPTVQSLLSAMDRGDMDEMSFAFRATRQEWNADYTERQITEVKLYDVSVVTYPANPATVTQIRSDEPTATRSYSLQAALYELDQIKRNSA